MCFDEKYKFLRFYRLDFNGLNCCRTKIWDIMTENQLTSNYRYIESIHSMRKPVISSEISPKFDGFKT